MANLKWIASLILAVTVVSALAAETRCPGNVESLPFRSVNRYQIVVPVSVNHSGPYNFLLDTGTQVTTVTPALAAGLNLPTQGEVTIEGVGSRQSAALAPVDLIQVGSEGVANQQVLIYGLQNLHFAGVNIQGILGENFLEHFDMLIDNAHSLLCLDKSAAMRAAVKGFHIPLAKQDEEAPGALPSMLIVEARLSDGMRPVRLKLDSGANSSLLYNVRQYVALPMYKAAQLCGNGVSGAQCTFLQLPAQEVKMGSLELSNVSFIAAARAQQSADFDGLLTLGIFRRVFICHTDHFAVLEPR
jgi:hypothetical protein